MISRRQGQTEGERLLAQGPREPPEPLAAEQRSNETGRRKALIASAVVFALLAALHLVAHLSSWAALVLALVTLALNRRFFPPLGRGRGGRSSLLRALFLLWLAVSIALTVLVVISGFYREDLILLAIVWGILAALWLADRLDRFVRAH